MSGADGRSSPAGPSGAAGGDQGNGQPKHNFKVISGFTKSQIDQLRQQITIFKKIKKGEYDFDFPGYVPRSATPQLRAHDQPDQSQRTHQHHQQMQQRGLQRSRYQRSAPRHRHDGSP